MKTWINPEPVEIPEGFLEAVEGNRIVAETLLRRGIKDIKAAQAFLHPDLYTPASPFELPDMEKAVERVRRAIDGGELIGIWGDFDVDGQTATTLLVTALQNVGANVVYTIPMRDEGHGITLGKLAPFLDQGIRLLITCDTGIAAHEAVAAANARGVDVIITDHHKLPDTLPDAFACINPQLVPPSHQLHTLPGVGAAYKLIEALYGQIGREDELESYLDLVALGIVADVAVQTGDTRYLLQRGLAVLRKTQRLGLQALMQAAELAIDQVNEENIGFSIGPRLNAIGRLDDAKMAVEFLSTHDREQARILANRIEWLNNERKLLSQQVFEAAQKQIENDPTLLNYNVLILAHAEWPASVLGIVANRLVEAYYRPTILLNAAPDGLAHGSARSVDGCDITNALSSHSHLLKSFGGHTMAAGLRLGTGMIDELRRALSRSVQIDVKPEAPKIQIDGYISLKELTPEFVRQLAQLAPFGAGNPLLTLASKNCSLWNHRIFGRQSEHLSLNVWDDSGGSCEIVQWRGGGNEIPQGKFNVAYTVRENFYRGETELLVQLVDFQLLGEPVQVYSPSNVQMFDHRTEQNPLEALRSLYRQYPDLLIWNEGEAIPEMVSCRRDQLKVTKRLVIWTAPPSSDIFKSILETVKPNEVYLFGQMHSENFVKRLAGLIKYALNQREGKINAGQLAALLGQRLATVHKGIDWLVAQGTICIVSKFGDDYVVEAGRNGGENASAIMTQLKAMLEETAAYQAHFARADKETLLT